MRTPRLARLTASFALAASLSLPAISPAQTIPNPSFETDAFTVAPGYSSGNGPITGWTSSKPASTGLNPASGSPFANNGTIPAGTNVAFIQSTAGGTDLGTTISGLTGGTAYRVSFRANARGSQNPTLKVSIDGSPVNTSVNFAAPAPGGVITSVNSANPYHYVEFEFTAAGATAALGLVNDAAGDNTVCVDDFQIALASDPLPPAIVGSRWTGDADSGVDSAYRYTHAHTFGNTRVNATVNGVLFTPTTGANPNVLDHMTWAGFASLFNDQTRTMTGGSNAVGRSFMFGGPNMSVQIKGLKPNTTYVATVYGVAWSDAGARNADFSGTAGGGPVNVNLNSYGSTNGIIVRYRYTTDGAGAPVTLNYIQSAGSAGSFHTAAFSNREAAPGTGPNPWSTAAWNDNATSGVNEGANYEYTHAYNLNSASNALVNGVTFLGRTGGNGVNPPGPVNFAMAGFGTGFANDANNVVNDGGSRTLANDFLYNGFPGALTLTGLTPGTEYQLTLFTVGWDDTPIRVTSYVGYHQTGAVYSQNIYGNNNGMRVNYVYTAPASGSITITTNPLSVAEGSMHLYAFANRKTTPDTTLAVTAHPQPVFVTTPSGSAVFSASGSGNLPLTYQWLKNGNPIPGETGTTSQTTTLTINNVGPGDVADYSCSFTGSGGQGTVTSNAARLHYIPDRVPGLFDSGVGNNGSVLPDGGSDPHYIITVNPDGPPLVPATVHDSTIFPIVAGPWLANSALSKWIAPQFNTVASQGEGVDAGAGPGVYVYRTTFNLTGYDLSTVRITGGWATDNLGVNIHVNGQPTGNINATQFPALTPFTINSTNATFQTGVNTLEFHVQNQTVTPGYTGLRVEGLAGYGSINPGTAPYIATQPVDTAIPWLGSNTLTVSAGGSATLTYQWFRNSSPVPGASGPSLLINADDAIKAGNYTVQVTNGVTSVTSNVAVVSFTGVPLQAGAITMSLEPGSSGKVTVASVLAQASGAVGPVQLAGVPSSSVQGGTISLVDGWIVYQPVAGFSGADSFEYFIEDSVTTATGTVSVAVAHGVGETFNILGIVNEGAGKRVTSLGIPGRSYQVQSTENLTTWSNLGPPQVCPNSGVISVLDPGPLPPSRFYRTIESP